MSKFVFTCGDINGIGPEIVIKTLNRIIKGRTKNQFVFICPENIFNDVSKIVKPNFDFGFSNSIDIKNNNKVTIVPLQNVNQKWGTPTKEAGFTSFNAIKLSFDFLTNKNADAVITAPISKTSINLAGINFPGHTEMYAKWCSEKFSKRAKSEFYNDVPFKENECSTYNYS